MKQCRNVRDGMENKEGHAKRDHLYIILVDDDIDTIFFSKLMSFCSEEKQQKVERFRFAADKKLSLYSHVFTRYIACEILRTENKSLEFQTNQYGKPYLKGYPNFHYNVSHTKNAIAFICGGSSVGVDIERIKKCNFNIANRFFTQTECDYIVEDASKSDNRFYEIWTKKEAYIKWVGKGLSIPLKSFNTLDEEIEKNTTTLQHQDTIISIYSEGKFRLSGITVLTETDFKEIFQNEV